MNANLLADRSASLGLALAMHGNVCACACASACACAAPAVGYPTQSLWYRVWGNPEGIPVLFVHGGPGNCVADYADINGTFFDTDKFYVVEASGATLGRAPTRAHVRSGARTPGATRLACVAPLRGAPPPRRPHGTMWDTAAAICRGASRRFPLRRVPSRRACAAHAQP